MSYTRRSTMSWHSSTSSLDDDEDAITPCPIEPQSQNSVAACLGSTPSQASEDTDTEHKPQLLQEDHNSSRTTDVEPELLWRRMLTIQRIFGCYNSARMRAALDMRSHGVGSDDGKDGLIRKYSS
jgi:hypothetical protein